MFVSDWMTTRVLTVSPETSVSQAIALMKDKRIKHLPVVDDGRLRGVISDSDLKYFIASRCLQSGAGDVKALINATPVKDIMSKTVSSSRPQAPVEEAAKTMHELKISCLPVVSDERVVGIITRSDVYRAFVDITGIRYGGNRIFLSVEDQPGSIREVTDRVRKYGFRLQSILTSYEGAAEGYRKLVVRTKGSGDINGLREELERHHGDVVIQAD